MAYRDCGICQKYLIDEKTGGFQYGRDGKPELRSMYDVNGVSVCPPMCRKPDGCPKGTPEKSRALNESNQQCYQHYLECKAVSSFPDDPVVRRNAAIIAEEIEKSERANENQWRSALVQLAGLRAMS